MCTIYRYLGLCVIAGVQTFRIIYHKHSPRSFHFGFLLLVFLWTAIRIMFFNFAGARSVFATLLLYWLPIDVQFLTFSLLVLFYAYSFHKRERGDWKKKRTLMRTVYVMMNSVVVLMTLGTYMCVWIPRQIR